MVFLIQAAGKQGRMDGHFWSRSKNMMKSLKAFVGNESGATAIEYALIASLIAVALVTILGALGTKLSGVFNEVSSALK